MEGRARVRGGRRGRGLRTRGSRGGQVSAEERRGGIVVVEPVGRGTRGGRGGRGTHAAPKRLWSTNELDIVDVSMMPVGRPLEQALHKKKMRVWRPETEPSTSTERPVILSSDPVECVGASSTEHEREWLLSPLLGESSPTPCASVSPLALECVVEVQALDGEVPPSPGMFVECGVCSSTEHSPFVERRPVVPPQTMKRIVEAAAFDDAVPPSPGMLVECGASSSTEQSPYMETRVSSPLAVSGDGTPRRRRRAPFMLPRRRVLKDDDILDELNFGSESSAGSDDDEDEEVLAPILISRTIQDGIDTPLDEDDILAASSVPPPLADLSYTYMPPAASSVLPPPADSSSTYMPHDLFDFSWSPFCDNQVDPKDRREIFINDGVGPTTSSKDIYSVFTEIWDQEIMGHIVVETNRYAQLLASKKILDGTLGPESRISFWVDTDVDELYTLFAIQLAMGVVIKSRLEEYWSNDEDIFCTPGFRAYMTLKRFQLLSTCLHFNNNAEMNARNLQLTKSEAKLYKIQPIVTHLNTKFQALYNLNRNIAIDESLLQWKGWLNINQFIANKAAKVGIKTYELCESQTGYLWRFDIHAFKDSPPASAGEESSPLDGATAKIVLKLMNDLENRGHTIWMDNFYNSPALARHLKSRGFDVVGTLRTNRKFVPQDLTSLTKSNMRPGQIVGCTSGDVDLMVWRDQNRVATISTYHGNAVAELNGKTKPIVVLDYNIMMGGVDKKDQLLAMYPIERKRTRVWYKKFFKRLLNVSVLNAFLITKHNKLAEAKEKNIKINVIHRACRQELIRTLLSRHSRPMQPITVPRNLNNVPTLMEAKKHYLAELPMGRFKARLRRKCCVCKKQTHFFCVGCDKSICIANCFVALHS